MPQGEMGVEQEPLGYEQATEDRRADAELVREERELRAMGAQVAVTEPVATAPVDTDRIVVRPTPDTIATLKGAQWTDRLPRLIQTRLLQSFENARLLRFVSRPDGRVVAQFSLNTEIRRFDMDLSRSEAVVEISVKLVEEGAGRIAAALDYVGVITVEMFLVEEAQGERIVVNEIAPRVHNSGHWTLDGAVTSQFEQHVRAICGWSLGSPARHGRIEMHNLIGLQANDWAALLGKPGVALHLYGKHEAREGRKMGHWTQVLPE
jgi:hypothetical protein